MNKVQLCSKGHDTFVVGRSSSGECRECSNNRSKRYWKRYPTRRKEINWKWYGIRNANGSLFTMADYGTLLHKQKGRCAICRIEQKRLKKALSVDHDHKIGSVRGLICNSHNVILGLVGYDKTLLTGFIRYLTKVMPKHKLKKKRKRDKK